MWGDKQVVLRALIAGACIAGATCIIALLTGSFGDTEWHIIATSLGFSLFTATGSSGDRLARKASAWKPVGTATVLASVLAFVLLVPAVWGGDDESVWRAFGVVGLLALCGSHLCLVLQAKRDDDSDLVTVLVWTAIAAALFNTFAGNLAILGSFDHVDEGFVRFVAVVGVVMVVSSALPPLMRRAASSAAPAAPVESVPAIADEIVAVASRLEAAQTPTEVRREAAALRDLAARVRR